MSLRGRILLSLLVVVLVPASVMWFGARREIEERLRSQYRDRVASLSAVVEEDLEREGREIHQRLSAFRESLAGDNRFRTAAEDRFQAEEGSAPASPATPDDQAYLLELASRGMTITGLSMLQIHDPSGRILSSGHFRNAFGLVDPELPLALSRLPDGKGLAPVRTAEGGFLALVRVDSLRIGGGYYHLVGGREVGSDFLASLARDPELSVRLVHPGGVVTSRDSGPEPGSFGDVEVRDAGQPDAAGAGEVARAVSFPFLASEPGEARFEIAFDGTVLEEIRRSTNLWFGTVLAGATVVSLLLAGWLSGRVTRPLQDLASQARRVDLHRLDVPFPTGRRDEIGQLSRVLKAMTGRLRAGARDLKEAERRATLGEMARQINHDVRNGLVPIRNVLRHLDDVARDSPEELAGVFRQRRGSLASSVSYLETLAGNYGRLSRRAGTGTTDAVAVVSGVVEAASAGSDVPVRMVSESASAPVQGDPVTLRRIVENLVANGKDAIQGRTSPEGGLPADQRPERNRGRNRDQDQDQDQDQDGNQDRNRDRSADHHPDDRPGVTVRIEALPASDTVRLVVEDTGRGMPPEEMERAFEDFFTTKEDGTGLGLSVVRRLVRDLGGSVSLESEEGRGTRVALTLPAGGSPDHRVRARTRRDPDRPPSGSRARELEDRR
ncbi:MAG: sensor histidine kinase [Gemmatimonadota bacterium]